MGYESRIYVVSKSNIFDDGRRYADEVALALLKSFQTDQWENENLAVLHYGY